MGVVVVGGGVVELGMAEAEVAIAVVYLLDVFWRWGAGASTFADGRGQQSKARSRWERAQFSAVPILIVAGGRGNKVVSDVGAKPAQKRFFCRPCIVMHQRLPYAPPKLPTFPTPRRHRQ